VNIDEADRERIIEAEWQLPDKPSDTTTYRADLRIKSEDRDGLIMDVSRILTDEKIKVKSLNARTVKFDAVITLSVEITSRNQLDKFISRVLSLTGVHEVERINS
jgi:GTP pyrophosphokinase